MTKDEKVKRIYDLKQLIFSHQREIAFKQGRIIKYTKVLEKVKKTKTKEIVKQKSK